MNKKGFLSVFLLCVVYAFVFSACGTLDSGSDAKIQELNDRIARLEERLTGSEGWSDDPIDPAAQQVYDAAAIGALNKRQYDFLKGRLIAVTFNITDVYPSDTLMQAEGRYPCAMITETAETAVLHAHLDMPYWKTTASVNSVVKVKGYVYDINDTIMITQKKVIISLAPAVIIT
ncbi:MAG: hypothetical protein LBP26_01950 [Clostridiales bacterium]|jgi:hypothetical protein|nr:hypothetical protein [Clostridiales bacterium]